MRIFFTKAHVLVLLVALNFLFGQTKSFGQTASQYGFTAVAGTYTAITGGTAMAILGDDLTSTAVNIGFNFTYCGTVYTQVRVCSNGWVSFNTATTANQWTNTLANLTAGTAAATIKPALMPFWDDLGGGGTGGNASFLSAGTAPNRVFTIQYKNWQSPVGVAVNSNVQVKLYETTNVIEYIYERITTAAATGASATIGIADGATAPTFLSLNNSTATPTASTATFTTNISGLPATGQIYRFTPPPNCSTVTGWPISATTTVTPGELCVSGNVTLSFNPITPLPAALGLSYQWQSATAVGGPWTNIGTSTIPTFTTPASTPLFYRCQLMCNTTTVIMTSSASAQLVVNNPGNPTVVGATRCGPGSLTLTATPPAGTTINWYTAATGGAPVATANNTYTTPVIPTTTTYYAAASMGGFGPTQTLATIAGGTNGCDGGAMFNIDPNVTINIDSFKALAPATANGVTVTIFTKTGTYLGSETTPAAWTTVATLTVNTTAAQMVNLALPTPLVINANVLTGVYIRYNASYTNIAAGTMYSNPDLDIVIGAGLCGSFVAGGVNAGRAFNGSVHYRTSGCEGIRQPVVATITPGPALSITKPATVCSGEIGNIVVTSTPMTNYISYAWTPNTADLYTNAATTAPYTAGSAPNVYFKSSGNGAHTYYLFSSGATPAACTHADTISIWVQPDSIKILGLPDTICTSGTTILSLSPNTGYAPNTIQWQVSTDGGINYSDVTGATGVNYTTPVLTTLRHYRALVKSSNSTCEMPVKQVIVANPTLISVADSFNCGPGTVTLKAVTGGYGSAVWYAVPGGGNPVGYGTPFVTPSLTTSTDYYVASGGGSVNGTKVVGAGALTSGTQTYNPFAGAMGGTKIQYLIRASELTAAGIPAGATISQLGMDVVAGGATYPQFAISMKNTSSTVLTTAYEAGANPVFPSTNVTPTSNALNNYLFSNQFVWDGTSNVLIQMCWSNGGTTAVGNTVKGDATTFVATSRGQVNSQSAANVCGLTTGTNTTFSNRPKFTFGYRTCQTPRQVVHAYIYPVPVVDLGPDVNMCVDAGAAIVLDAGYQPNTPLFLWDNNTTSQVRAVNSSGTYNVKVTNGYTCVGSDTVNILLRKNPVVNLGNDTTVCNGVVLTLNPGGGSIEYFWNTGQVGQTIDVNAAGSYSVFVTNAEGCTVSDTIQVMMQGELPSIRGIQISNNGIRKFHFTAVYPQNVIGYDWDFGDGSLHSYEASPYHEYDSVGDYIVVLNLSSTCGFTNDTVGAHIVGIHQLNVNNDELTVYPNPSNGQATILNKGDLKMEKIDIYNILGQVVYRSKADSKDKHVINLSNIASGIYTIEVYTDKGTVARKLEILK